MRLLFLSGLLSFLLTIPSSLFALDDHGAPATPAPYVPGIVMTKAVQAGITPDAAVEILKAGNERFAAGTPLPRNTSRSVKETASGQYPFAGVLCCMDSRVPAETLFDQSVGDIFVIRLAGNVIDADVLGSLEYAAKAGARAIVVLGHTNCGAVKGACDNVNMGNLTGLLQKIQPAVAATRSAGERTSKNPRFVDDVVETHVKLSIQNIRTQSPILKEMEAGGAVKIVGALYDVTTGRVVWR